MIWFIEEDQNGEVHKTILGVIKELKPAEYKIDLFKNHEYERDGVISDLLGSESHKTI